MELTKGQLSLILFAENKLFSAKVAGAIAVMWGNNEIEELLLIIHDLWEHSDIATLQAPAEPSDAATPERETDHEWDTQRGNWFRKGVGG